MEKIKQRMMELMTDEEGATMVEYGLMVALIAVVCIVAVQAIGTNLSDMFDEVSGYITSAEGGGGNP